VHRGVVEGTVEHGESSFEDVVDEGVDVGLFENSVAF